MFGSIIVAAIGQIIMNMAESAIGDAARKQILDPINQQLLAGKVRAAVDNAGARFLAESDDQELTHALQAARFDENPAIAALLARVATGQQAAHAAELELAGMLHQLVPTIATHRCHAAARRLISLTHTEVGMLPELHQTVMILRGEQMREDLHRLMPTPEYLPGLRERIMDAAVASASDLGHGYVTTAHLFYAVQVQAQGLVPPLLRQRHITPQQTIAALRDAIQPYAGPVADPMTPNAVRILDRARAIARDAYAPWTRDDHVMLAILEQVPTSKSLEYLTLSLHIDVSELRAAILREGQVTSMLQLLRPPPTAGIPPV